MFDRIEVPCPHCGTVRYFQSKAGECLMHTFTLKNVPPLVYLGALHYPSVECEKCHTDFHLKPPNIPRGDMAAIRLRCSWSEHPFVKEFTEPVPEETAEEQPTPKKGPPTQPEIIESMVAYFATLMRSRLMDNLHKGGWRKCSVEVLLQRLHEELGEFIAGGVRNGWHHPSTEFEAADVANFLMMIIDPGRKGA